MNNYRRRNAGSTPNIFGIPGWLILLGRLT